MQGGRLEASLSVGGPPGRGRDVTQHPPAKRLHYLLSCLWASISQAFLKLLCVAQRLSLKPGSRICLRMLTLTNSSGMRQTLVILGAIASPPCPQASSCQELADG